MKILIANDGSRFGRSAVEFAAKIVGGHEAAEVKVVTVIEPAAGTEMETLIESVDDLIDPANPEDQRAERIAGLAAEQLREKCQGQNVAVSHQVLAGPAARTIVETAEEWGADMIVVGTHGNGFWKRALIGSVSDRVARHASCSVLIVRDETDA